jgi:death-on-curing protein
VAEVSYLTFGDCCRIAAEVLGTTPEQIARLPRIALADSALASPGAGFGDQDAYPNLIEKAAVLVEHLARNHPLPDGNKRCAFLTLERFLAANGQPIKDADPDTDVPMVERIAAGKATPDEIIDWLESRTTTSLEGEAPDNEA